MPTLTTNLGLAKPSGSEAADIAVINSNSDLLDGVVVTPSAVQSLTNKTLTSPIITNPTITAGPMTITAGGLVIQMGGQTITAGGLLVSAGGVQVTAGGVGVNTPIVAGVDLAIVAPGKIMTNGGQVGVKFNVLTSIAAASAGNRLFNTYDIGPGFVFIFTQSVCAMYQVDVGTVTLLYGDTTLWGITSGGAGAKTNVYWNAGNSRVELTNNTAGTLSYYIVGVGL